MAAFLAAILAFCASLRACIVALAASALARLCFHFAVKAATAFLRSVSACTTSAAFLALARAADFTARAFAIAVRILALRLAVFAAAFRAEFRAVIAAFFLIAEPDFCAIFFAAVAFLRATVTAFAEVFASFCSFATAASAVEIAGL